MANTRSLRYGWIPQIPDFRDLRLSHSPAVVAARPSSVDLRSKMPPIWDQGTEGACTGHAVAAAFSYNLGVLEGGGSWTPSRQFIYYNGRRIEGTTAVDAGAQIRDVVKGVADWGVPPESDWPYVEADFAVQPSDAAYLAASLNVITSYLAVSQSVDGLCTTLASGEPIVFGFSVYDYFEGDQIAKDGILHMPESNETMQGGHAVLIVGYNDANKMFTVRNSWGSDWGDGGYFYMPYAYATNRNLAGDFWAIRSVSKPAT